MAIAIVIVAGLIIGSFLNAVIFRLHTGRSFISGRSECPHCGHVLVPWDLIPIFSFAYLHGRCRYCQEKISLQYPLVELITTLVFLLAFIYHLSSITYFFACFLIVIAVYDLKHYLILDKVVVPVLGLVILHNLFLGWHALGFGLLSGFGIAGFFLIQYLISRGRWIGFGDVKLGLLLGNLAGWPASLLVLLIAYFSGAIVGVVLIISGHKRLGSKLPFGLFLSFSAIIVMLFGNPIITWYFKLIGL